MTPLRQHRAGMTGALVWTGCSFLAAALGAPVWVCLVLLIPAVVCADVAASGKARR